MKSVILIPAFLLVLTLVGCRNRQKPVVDHPTVVVRLPEAGKAGFFQGDISGCGYNNILTDTLVELGTARQREIDQINSILKYSGLSSNFKIFSASINNAVALILDQQRYILYDPALLGNSDKNSGDYWSSMSILAHEIGHHLSGHTISDGKSSPGNELEADRFSGFILYKMGASSKEILSAIQSLATVSGSESHPPKVQRLQAITAGWNEAFNTRFDSAIPPPPANEELTYNVYDYRRLIEEDSYLDTTTIYTEEEYADYDFFYGVITDVVINDQKIDSIYIHVKKTGTHWGADLNGQKIVITLDDYYSAPEMCNACHRSIGDLLVPGRRIKFAFVEGRNGGTIENGWLRLTYVEGLPGNTF